jgi:hypothetical protein
VNVRHMGLPLAFWFDRHTWSLARLIVLDRIAFRRSIRR